MTYYVFLKFMYGIPSTYRQQSFDVSGHIKAMQKTNLEADWVSYLFPYIPFTKPPHSQLQKNINEKLITKLCLDTIARVFFRVSDMHQRQAYIMFPCWNTLDFRSTIRSEFPKTFPRGNKKEVDFSLEVAQCSPARRDLCQASRCRRPDAWWWHTCLWDSQQRQLLHQFNDKLTSGLIQDRQQRITRFHKVCWCFVHYDHYQEYNDGC